jgi:uncharacterized protein with PQ loop repeat
MIDPLYFGFGGLIFSLLYRIPQIYKMVKTKSVQDISTYVYHVQNISYIFYIIYGFMISDIVYIVSSFVSVGQNIIVLSLYYYYKLA